MGDGTGTKTSLIGEDTTGNALFHAEEHASDDTSCHCGWRERTFKDGDKHTWNHTPVKNYDAKSQDDVQKCHKRNELFRYLSDPLDAAKQNQGDQNGNDDTNGQIGDGSLFLGDHMEIDQGRVDCGGDGVNLCGVAGTEYSQDAKSCEQICQPEKTPAQTIFNIVHGAAYQISIGIFFTIINR